MRLRDGDDPVDDGGDVAHAYRLFIGKPEGNVIMGGSQILRYRKRVAELGGRNDLGRHAAGFQDPGMQPQRSHIERFGDDQDHRGCTVGMVGYFTGRKT